MARGNGAFVVVELLERIRSEGEPATRKEVVRWFKGFEKIGGDGEVKGWSVLLEKLESLRSLER